jgi:Na+/melibiose symporter-like transporter
MLIFLFNCFIITVVIYYIDNCINKKEIEFNDILLFVFTSLFICYNFPSLYVAIIAKVRFDR